MRNLHHAVQAGSVQRHRRLGGFRVDATHHLGNGSGGEVRVAWILAFRRESEKEVGRRLEAALLENRKHFFIGRAGVGRGFEHHELPTPKAFRDVVRGGMNIGVVGFTMLA